MYKFELLISNISKMIGYFALILLVLAFLIPTGKIIML